MKKTNLIKLISAVLCVAVLAVTICIVLINQDSKAKPALVYETESGTKLDTSSVQNMPKGLTFVSNADTFSATSVSLTATVLPTTAVNKALDWSIAWAEPDGWTSGKTVTDYIDLSSSDNVATVTFKKLFNVKAVITATSKDNPEAKASCNVDCAKRLLSANMTMNSADRVTWNFNNDTPVLPLLPVITTNANSWIQLKSQSTVEYDYTYSEGTIDNNILATEMYLEASESLMANTIGKTRFDTQQILSKSQYFEIFSYGIVVEGLCGYSADSDIFSSAKFVDLANTLKSVDTEDFTLIVRHYLKYGDFFDVTYKCRFDRTKGPFAVSEVNFDNGGLVL